ncbi:PKD domain-containing protein [Leeuwenhoekiella sp. MAR_2009_132]|uniref:PKD domain-containing protein n=1 Tax=Leeuwenhoekiella sp. MAR_2009_132 TaxID=1392489 RepID=UPI00068E45F3|nr:PKD domain-containing protein [Leeuwenhoekiella sp. MAR_2009_132]
MNTIKQIAGLHFFKFLFSACMIFSLIACDFEYDLPEEGSIEDLTPPEANFTASQSDTDFLTYSFANFSGSATTYAWDFGDGNTANTRDAINTYPDEGTYTVSLTASDALGKTDTFTTEITIVEPPVPTAITPEIGAAEFQDAAGICGTGDSRDCWRISGGSIHQTTSDGRNGTRGAKFTTASSNSPRVSYQAVTVSANTKYILTAYYAIQSDGDSVRATVIDGQLNNFSEFANAPQLGQTAGTTNDGKGNFNRLIVEFETGANGNISILFDSGANASESYLDDVSIIPAE